MTDEAAEQLTPAEERVRALIQPFSEERAPHGEEMTRAVSRRARWQRPVRRVLFAVGTAAAMSSASPSSGECEGARFAVT